MEFKGRNHFVTEYHFRVDIGTEWNLKVSDGIAKETTRELI